MCEQNYLRTCVSSVLITRSRLLSWSTSPWSVVLIRGVKKQKQAIAPVNNPGKSNASSPGLKEDGLILHEGTAEKSFRAPCTNGMDSKCLLKRLMHRQLREQERSEGRQRMCRKDTFKQELYWLWRRAHTHTHWSIDKTSLKPSVLSSSQYSPGAEGTAGRWTYVVLLFRPYLISKWSTSVLIHLR